MIKIIERILLFITYIGLIFMMHNKVDYIKKNKIKIFLNKPCDKLLPSFPEFKKFVENNNGKYNIIFINFDKYPFLFYQSTYDFDIEKINRFDLKKLKSEEIENKLIELGAELV